MADTQPFASTVTVSAEVDPLLGMDLGEFRVDSYLAQGGMGRVYRAYHRQIPSLRRAVKVLHDGGADSHEAFRKEALAASQVKSINIVAIHDFGFLPDGAPFLMMELLEGETLEERLHTAGRLHFLEALFLIQQVFAALSSIHAAGLVHRDIKPANLFLVKDPAHGVVVKVMDLGLAASRPARLLDSGVGAEREQRRAGSPIYASPEQFGERVVGPASDVYSTGVVLYELLAGEVPFPEIPGDDGYVRIAACHVEDRPPDIRDQVPGLPEEVGAFVMALLDKQPARRPTVGAAQNLARRLREQFAGEGPTQVRQNPLAHPATTARLPLVQSRGRREQPRAAWVIAALAVGLLGAGAAWWVTRPAPTPEVERPAPVATAPRTAVVDPAPPPPAADPDDVAALPGRPGEEAARRNVAPPPRRRPAPSPRPAAASSDAEPCDPSEQWKDNARRSLQELKRQVAQDPDPSAYERFEVKEIELGRAILAATSPSDCARVELGLGRLARELR